MSMGAAASAACNETYEVSGRQVRVEADAGLEMCAGTVEHMDRFVERFAAELGLPLTDEPWIDYRWMEWQRFLERNPCGGMPACALIRTVYSSEIPHEHELVHAAASDLGLAHPFFVEGLATAFEGNLRADELTLGEVDGTTGEEEDAWPDVVAVLREGYMWLPGDYYEVAGAFTRYLIDRFGLRMYLEYYRRTWWGDSYAALDRDFQAVFGEPLAAAAADFKATRSDCGVAGYRFKLLECEAPELEWDGRRLARYFTIDCEDAAAFGQAGASVRLVHSLEVPAGGRYRVELRGGRDTSVTLGSCGGCERQAIARVSGATRVREVELPAGRYFLRAETGSAEPMTFGLVIEQVGE
jgi:hypothetical protein